MLESAKSSEKRQYTKNKEILDEQYPLGNLKPKWFDC